LQFKILIPRQFDSKEERVERDLVESRESRESREKETATMTSSIMTNTKKRFSIITKRRTLLLQSKVLFLLTLSAGTITNAWVPQGKVAHVTEFVINDNLLLSESTVEITKEQEQQQQQEQQHQEQQHQEQQQEQVQKAIASALQREHDHQHYHQQQQQQAQQQQHTTSVWQDLESRFVMEEYVGVSEKCRVYSARLRNPSSGPNEECIIKISNLHALMYKEAENYKSLKDDSKFIKMYEYHEARSETDVSAIIMEKGHTDIYKWMQTHGTFKGRGLQEVALQVAGILRHLHVDQGLVWCELKSGNFVLTETDGFKAIDVESAVKQAHPNLLYTATYAPPEYAAEDLCGRNMAMEFSFDIWSYGMLLYEMATGELYITTQGLDRNDRVGIFSHVKNMIYDGIDLSKLDSIAAENPRLKDLIGACLTINPADRLTIQQVIDHPYFQGHKPTSPTN